VPHRVGADAHNVAVYILRRVLLMIPTLIGIMLINFLIVQMAPGGPIDQIIEQMQSGNTGVVSTRATGGGGESGGRALTDGGNNPATRGLDPEILADLEKQFGFDKPLHVRFFTMMKNYATLDFGQSYFQDRPVVDMVIERLPVSISLGLWSMMLIYSISLPLGVRKAVGDGTRFDIWTSAALFIGYAIPGFIFAVLLIIVFAGGSYYDWFPLRGLVSDNWDEMSWPARIKDYFWHLALPISALTIGGFATLTMLTKNSFLEEISKQFVLTARAKGMSERRVMYGHVFRNAMLIVIAGFPAALIGILFTGSMLIEVIFSLDGIGLLGFEAIITRDYPIMFGTLFVFTVIGLVLHLIGDVTYTLIDPRIDFESR
jgi:microcin C transport system permease protein